MAVAALTQLCADPTRLELNLKTLVQRRGSCLVLLTSLLTFWLQMLPSLGHVLFQKPCAASRDLVTEGGCLALSEIHPKVLAGPCAGC